jgi:hypothetical protein
LTAPAVTVGAGQKVIVRASVEYDGTLANGGIRNVTQTITDSTAVVYNSNVQSVNTDESHVVDQVVEILGLVGVFTFQVRAVKDSNSNPIITPTNLSMVVMVVSA